jgi:hypothetical protein
MAEASIIAVAKKAFIELSITNSWTLTTFFIQSGIWLIPRYQLPPFLIFFFHHLFNLFLIREITLWTPSIAAASGSRPK